MEKIRSLNKARNLTEVFCTAMIMIILSGLISCQKVINLDLNSASPQLVVEANIYDLPGPYYIKLSKTVNFDDITEIPPVTGAIVEISDSTSGTRETLTELEDGIYSTAAFSGIAGHSYKLTINTDGQIYEAVSEMPYPVGFFKMDVKRVVGSSSIFGGGNNDQTVNYSVDYEINDPAEYNNYYRIVVYRADRQINSGRVFSDQYHNGKIITDDFTLHDTIDFNPGDTVRIELQNIDKNTYNFFRTLREGTGGLSFLSASPSNPISNITNNGLGYFSASSLVEEYIIIPQ